MYRDPGSELAMAQNSPALKTGPRSDMGRARRHAGSEGASARRSASRRHADGRLRHVVAKLLMRPFAVDDTLLKREIVRRHMQPSIARLAFALRYASASSWGIGFVSIRPPMELYHAGRAVYDTVPRAAWSTLAWIRGISR